MIHIIGFIPPAGTKDMQLNLTPAQQKTCQALAQKAGMTYAQYVAHLLEPAIRDPLPKAFDEFRERRELVMRG